MATPRAGICPTCNTTFAMPLTAGRPPRYCPACRKPSKRRPAPATTPPPAPPVAQAEATSVPQQQEG